MSADKIIEKILEKANEDVALIEQETAEKVQSSVAAIERRTELTLNALKNKEKADVEEVHRRSQLMTRLDSRKTFWPSNVRLSMKFLTKQEQLSTLLTKAATKRS